MPCLRFAPCLLGLLLMSASMPGHARCERSYTVPIWDLGHASGMDARGNPTGFFGDLYREVARRSGCRLIYELIPMKRITMMVQNREVAIRGPSGLPHADEDKDIVFIPLMRDAIQLVVRKEARGLVRLDQSGAHSSLVFGSLRGAYYGDWADAYLAALPARQHEQVSNVEGLYRMLGANRIQATFANAYVHRWQLQQLKLESAVAVLPISQVEAVPLGVKLDRRAMSAADFDLLAQHFEAVRDDGSFGRAIARYLGKAQARLNTAGTSKLPRVSGK